MKSLIIRDKKRRFLVKKFESKRLIYKLCLRYGYINENQHMIEIFRKKLEKLPRDSNPVRVQNRCIITGRARGVHRKFKLSRISIRELASSGKLTGVTKSSW